MLGGRVFGAEQQHVQTLLGRRARRLGNKRPALESAERGAERRRGRTEEEANGPRRVCGHSKEPRVMGRRAHWRRGQARCDLCTEKDRLDCGVWILQCRGAPSPPLVRDGGDRAASRSREVMKSRIYDMFWW